MQQFVSDVADHSKTLHTSQLNTCQLDKNIPKSTNFIRKKPEETLIINILMFLFSFRGFFKKEASPPPPARPAPELSQKSSYMEPVAVRASQVQEF